MKCLVWLFCFFLFSCESSKNKLLGGYSYSSTLNPKDTNFYLYPIRDLLSKRDSFNACYDYMYYVPLNEPNLSVKPLTHKTYRFVYWGSREKFIVITIDENFITTKVGNTSDLLVEDTTKLTIIENLHFRILSRSYPIKTTGTKTNRARYLDSMVRLYPELLETDYYHNLYQRVYSLKTEAYCYKMKKIALTKDEFASLIEEIDGSGFWKLPLLIDCDVDMADGDGFSLEANTDERYQSVLVRGCPNDTTRFTRACQTLVRYAGLSDEINLVWGNDKHVDRDTTL